MPIAFAVWDTRRGRDYGFTEVVTTSDPQARDTVSSAPAARVARYLARRGATVDALLPEGVGGTRFYEQLDSAAGRAFLETATIGLVADIDEAGDAESTEIHERAHLVFFALPREADRLLARLRAPYTTEYAAESPSEHFAEMARGAWDILVPPFGMCYALSPIEMLADAEQSVPGTAGFVARFLRHAAFDTIEGRAVLVAEADRHSAAQRAEWNALWKALDRRRERDGSFARWPAMSVREYIRTLRRAANESDNWLHRFFAVTLLPSLAVATLFR